MKYIQIGQHFMTLDDKAEFAFGLKDKTQAAFFATGDGRDHLVVIKGVEALGHKATGRLIRHLTSELVEFIRSSEPILIDVDDHVNMFMSEQNTKQEGDE